MSTKAPNTIPAMPYTGRPLAIDGKEFGETYHVAAALALDHEWKAAVMPPEETYEGSPIPSGRIVEFLSVFSDDRRILKIARPTDGELKRNYTNVGCSTDIYCGKWSPVAAHRLREPILRAVGSNIATVEAFLDKRGIERGPMPAALVWVRNRQDKETKRRNSSAESIRQITTLLKGQNIRAIRVGERLDDPGDPAHNLIEFYKQPPFRDAPIALQLLMVFRLMCNYGVRFSVGMKSGGMDGAALFLGLPTISFARRPKRDRPDRVEKISAAISNFRVIRLDRYNGDFRQHTEREMHDLRAEIKELGLA